MTAPLSTDALAALTMPQALARRAEAHPDALALREKVRGVWTRVTWAAYFREVRHVAIGLYTLGFRAGDRLAIASENTPEWLYADLAAQMLGGACLGIYPTNPWPELQYIVRHSRANQLGLLGFGGDLDNDRAFLFEGSIGILLRRDLVIGYEYRQKPDNLGFADEDDWHDAFLAWFPNKHLSLTGAWVDLGSVGGRSGQDGFYLSLEGSY